MTLLISEHSSNANSAETELSELQQMLNLFLSAHTAETVKILNWSYIRNGSSFRIPPDPDPEGFCVKPGSTILFNTDFPDKYKKY